MPPAAFPGEAGAGDLRRGARDAEEWDVAEGGDHDEDWDWDRDEDREWAEEDWDWDRDEDREWAESAGGWAEGAPGDVAEDRSSELPYRVACFAHPGQLTSVHCRGCGRPICWDCDVTASEVGSGPRRRGPLCRPCATDRPPGAVGRRREPARSGVGRFTLTPVVAGLVAINTAVFAATATHARWEVDLGQFPAEIARGQVYRLVTAMFVHVGATHLLFNMVALLVLGPPVEAALGRVRFSSLYLLAGVVGFGFSFLLGPVNGLSVGASGAIFGVCGAWYSLARAKHKDTAAFALLLILLLVYSFYEPSVDWRAHVGGLATGLAAGALVARTARWPRRRALPELAGAATVLAVLAAMVLVSAGQIRR